MVLSNVNVTEGIMSADEKMTIDERRKYLRKMQSLYLKADRKERGRMLDEMQQVLDMHRKSLSRLLLNDLSRKARTRQRGRTYGLDVLRAVSVIAESLDFVCSERLKPNLAWMAEHLAAHGELELAPTLLEKLEQLSVSTLRRMLQHQSKDVPRLPRKGPSEANQYRRNVPVRRIPWNEQEPGHMEVDLVHHCGPSASGQYVHTLQLIDVATGWSERAAMLGRSYLAIEDAFKRSLARLPFELQEIHPDNDSAFFNRSLETFWEEHLKHVDRSRSRAWQKNDNRFVEQKNSSLVRAYIGYNRLDTVEQTRLLNQLYDRMWIYYNLFQPVMRLEEKIRVPLENGRSRTKRRYDTARTPFDRLLETNTLSEDIASRLMQLRAQTNPRELREEIQVLLTKLHRMPSAAEGQSQDVHLTLFSNGKPRKGEDSSVTLSFGRTIPVR
jgi:hypothetical protein